MLERDSVEERRLLTFRLPIGIDPLVRTDPFVGERIGDHRAAYLVFEGDIGGGRGVVERLWSGRIEAMEERPGAIEITLGGVRWHGSETGARWHFERA